MQLQLQPQLKTQALSTQPSQKQLHAKIKLATESLEVSVRSALHPRLQEIKEAYEGSDLYYGVEMDELEEGYYNAREEGQSHAGAVDAVIEGIIDEGIERPEHPAPEDLGFTEEAEEWREYLAGVFEESFWENEDDEDPSHYKVTLYWWEFA
jgi:hypothetical protein